MKFTSLLKAATTVAFASVLVACGNSSSSSSSVTEIEFFSQKPEMQATLQEIVEYTGSDVAKQLLDLEQQQAVSTVLPKPDGDHSMPGPAASAQSVEPPSIESVVPAMEPTPPVIESKPN